jgi:hypothetical protein
VFCGIFRTGGLVAGLDKPNSPGDNSLDTDSDRTMVASLFHCESWLHCGSECAQFTLR